MKAEDILTLIKAGYTKEWIEKNMGTDTPAGDNAENNSAEQQTYQVPMMVYPQQMIGYPQQMMTYPQQMMSYPQQMAAGYTFPQQMNNIITDQQPDRVTVTDVLAQVINPAEKDTTQMLKDFTGGNTNGK